VEARSGTAPGRRRHGPDEPFHPNNPEPGRGSACTASVMESDTTQQMPTIGRLTRFREKMRRLGLDTFLVLIDANRRFLSGYSGEDGQFDETAGALLITERGGILATDSRYDLQARQEAQGFDVVC